MDNKSVYAWIEFNITLVAFGILNWFNPWTFFIYPKLLGNGNIHFPLAVEALHLAITVYFPMAVLVVGAIYCAMKSMESPI